MNEILNLAAPFGIAGFMAVLIFVAYDRMAKELIQVVRNNTEATIKLAGIVDGMCDRVIDNNQKLQVIDSKVERANGMLERIDRKMESKS